MTPANTAQKLRVHTKNLAWTLFLTTLFLGWMVYPGIDQAKAKEAKIYKINLPNPDVSANAVAQSPITILTAEGWKWNMEYPARFSIKTSPVVAAVPGEFSHKTANIKVEGKQVTLPLELKGLTSGKGTVTLTGNFSICNDETCKLFRNESFDFDVVVK